MNCRRAFAVGLMVALSGLASGAGAVESPRPGLVDARIRTVHYNADQVVSLNGYLGYQMMIEFGPEERIENVSIGDGLGWQVTPNKKATLLFLKPLSRNAITNMTVVTDHRRYAFELRVRNGSAARPSEMAYVVRFLYPPEPLPPRMAPPLPPPPPVMRNLAYTYTGSRVSLPSLVFDDGRFTYFQWPENTATPALFFVAADGSESIVNYNSRDGYQIVELVGQRFVLRNGKDVTYVINEAWRTPSAGDLAPKPHDRATTKRATREGVGP